MKSLVATFVLLCLQVVLLAQSNVTIKGTVKDQQTNEAIIGCSIALKNATTGTVSDVDGSYTITVPTDAVLVFTYIGYTTITTNVY